MSAAIDWTAAADTILNSRESGELPESQPFFTGLMLDADHRVWVGGYLGSWAGSAVRKANASWWTVVTLDGQVVARAHFPAEVYAQQLTPVLDIQGDRVLIRLIAIDDGCCSCAHSRVPISGSKAERYQVVIHFDPDTLDAQAEPGMAELEDGTRVSAETARRFACDCSLVLMSRDADGSPLDVGRKTRTISPALRRALNARDKGCRFPGCHVRLSSGHHLRHWADGGDTSLENCVLLCGSHHYLVHEGGWTVEWLDQGQPVFHNPRGDSFFGGMWDPPEIGDMPVEDLVNRNRARGVEV